MMTKPIVIIIVIGIFASVFVFSVPLLVIAWVLSIAFLMYALKQWVS